jgi:MFS family permease
LENVTSDTYLWAAILLRLVQGFGISIIFITQYSIAASLDNKTRNIGYLEAAYGFGNIIGPPLASKFYGQYGYKYTFYAFGSLEILNILLIFTMRESKLSDFDRSTLLSP